MIRSAVKNFIFSFFPGRAKRELKELYVSVAMMDSARTAVMLFEAVYLFQLGFSITQIMFFYLAIYIALFFMYPLGMKAASYFGYEHSILYSSPFWVAYYLSLMAIQFHWAFVPIAIISICIYKSLYWTSYHSDFAQYSVEGQSGREVSSMSAISGLASALGPFIAGLILLFSNFSVLFIFVAAVFFLSNIPLLSTKEVFTRDKFSYFKAFSNLFKKNKIREFFSSFAFGEEFVWSIIWPLYIFLVIGNYFEMGAIVAASSLAVLAVSLIVGRLSDRKGKHRVLKYGVVFYSMSFFLRLLANSPLGVFLVEAYSKLTNKAVYIPKHALINRSARRSRTREKVLFFIMSLVLGKIFIILICLAAFSLLPGFSAWHAIFVFTGFVSLLFLLTP